MVEQGSSNELQLGPIEEDSSVAGQLSMGDSERLDILAEFNPDVKPSE